MGFSINPPNAPLVMADGRTVSPEWWRFFKEVQGTVGGPSSPFEDMAFLAARPAPMPEPAPDVLHPSAVPVAYAAIADHEAKPDPHPVYLTQAEGDARYAELTGDTFSGAVLTTAGGIGYAAGAGGTVAQATSKSTAVTLDELTGEITTDAAALASATIVSFTLNNSQVTATDQVVTSHHAGGTIGAYTINGRATGAGTAEITLRNNTSGSLSQALVIKFSVLKSVIT